MAVEQSYRDHLTEEERYLENELEKACRKLGSWSQRVQMLTESLARTRKEIDDLNQTRPETA